MPEVIAWKTDLRIIPPAKGPFGIRIAGARQDREDGFVGMDAEASETVDFVHDPASFPWPVDDGVVDRLYCAYYLHRLDMPGRLDFFHECWRVLKDGGQLAFVVPHWSCESAYADPRAKWPPFCASFLTCLNRKWREENKITLPDVRCNFECDSGYGLDTELLHRNQDYQMHALRYWTNTARDLHVTLARRA